MQRSVPVLLIALSGACAPRASLAPCNQDAECAPEERCELGVCEEGPRPQPDDAGPPAAPEDAGPPPVADAGPPPVADAGPPDAGEPDAGPVDAGPPPVLPRPALALSFDDVYGLRTYAATPKDHPLTLGASSRGLGVFGAGLILDGASRGDLGAVDTLPIDTTYETYAVCAWLATNARTVSQVVHQHGGSTNGAALVVDDLGRPGIAVRRASTLTSLFATTVLDGVPHHVCGEMSVNGGSVWVDGVREATGPGSEIRTGSAGHGLGANAGDSVLLGVTQEPENYLGIIDDLRVYADRPLSDAEVQLISNTPVARPGPRYAFTFDGFLAADNLGHAGGNANVAGATRAAGVNGQGLLFALDGDAANIGYDVEDFPEFEETNEITISAWVRPDLVGGIQTLYQLGGNNNCAALSLEDGVPTFNARHNDALQRVQSPGALPIGVFSHVAAVFSPTSVRLVVDGSVTEVLHDNATWSSGIDGHGLGRYNLTSSCFNGEINANDPESFRGMLDDLRVYTYALDDDEMAADALREAP